MEVIWLLKVGSWKGAGRPVLLCGAGGHWEETSGCAGSK